MLNVHVLFGHLPDPDRRCGWGLGIAIRQIMPFDNAISNTNITTSPITATCYLKKADGQRRAPNYSKHSGTYVYNIIVFAFLILSPIAPNYRNIRSRVEPTIFLLASTTAFYLCLIPVGQQSLCTFGHLHKHISKILRFFSIISS